MTTAAQALQNLATAFQASPGAITLGAAAFQSAGFSTPSTFDADLAGALLPDGGAAVTLSAASVPAPDGSTLTFGGTATVGLLGMGSAPLWVQVTAVDAGDDAPTVQLMVGLTGLDAAGWVLGTSFSGLQLNSLADLGTAGATALFSPAGRVLLYATDADPSFAGLSALSAAYSASVTVPVAAGLNFFATCTTPQSSAWPVLGAIESLAPPDTFLLAGTIDPSMTQGSAPAAYPVMSLSGTLGTSTVQLGGFGVAGPVLDISVTGSAAGQQAFGMGLVFTLSFNGTPLPVVIGTGTVGGTAAPPAIGTGGGSGTGQAPVSYTVTLQPGQVVSALFSDLESLLGLSSGTVSGAVPAPAQQTLTDTLPFDLQDLSFTITTGTSGTSLTQLTAVLGTTQPVPLSVGSDTVTLESVNVTVTYTPAAASVPASTAATIAATADFSSTFNLDGADTVTVVLGVDDADVSFYGAFTGSITVGDIATALLGKKTGTALDDIGITGVSVSLDYDTSTSTFTDWSLGCTIEDGSTVPMASAAPTADASVLVTSSGGQMQVLLSGSILLGDNLLQLMVDLSSLQQQTSVVVTASWSQPPGAPGLTLLDVLQELGIGIASLPSGLDLSVVGISIGYATAPGVLAIDAVGGSGGQLLFVYRSGTATDYGLLLEIPATLNLDHLPVVGATLSELGTLTLGGMQFVAASAALATEAAVLNTLPAQAGLTGSLPQFPALPAGSTSAIVFMATLTSGTTPIPLTMALDGGTTTGGSTSTLALPAATGAARSAALPAAASSSSAPSVSWVNVQRAFGPVQVNRVGVAFGSGSSLEVALDASLSLAGLSVGLAGLGITVPLSAPFTPTFSLSGLQVDYSGGGLTIAGGMQTVTPGQVYAGDLAISFESFSAVAVGEYTVGPPASLFAYFFASAPIGGPPFFFITGLALGLGYNTALTIPSITGVSADPLVQVAMGQESGDTLLQNISTLAPPSPGEDWLAVGVRFTSFETVSSFALLSVQWGTQVEIALLGESTLTVPPTPSGSSTGETIVAQAQLVLELTVQPDSGQFTLNAQLTPSSYVFDPAAALTGGFAWYQWWDPSPYAGDFVVTLGGYNPYWTPPSYYPVVPRLGLNWRIGAELTITGDLYFALTPSVVMAGGGLSATWQSGAISAWFDADADFLVRFKPFQYSADLSVSIGASVRVNLLVTHVTITIHVGVALALWGPPFGGTATVDLSIVKFTISFRAGPQPAQNTAIGWQEFTQTFLPAPQSGQGGTSTLAVADDGTATPTDTLITIQVAAGLVGQSSAGTQVDPATLSLAIATQIPGNAATLPNDASTPMAGVPATPLGIGPMGIPAAPADQGGVTVSLAITTQRLDDDTLEWGTDPTQWSATPSLGTAPAALWANTTSSLQNPTLVQPVLTGVTLVPVVPPPATTQPVALAELLDDDAPVETVSWSGATPPTSDDFDPSTAWSTLQSTLTQPTGSIPQSALLASLRAQGLTTAASVNVAAFAADAQELLSAPPALRLLGETR